MHPQELRPNLQSFVHVWLHAWIQQGHSLLCLCVHPAQALAQLPNASPEALETLVGMGFDSAQAARALQQAHNDIQTALALLL